MNIEPKTFLLIIGLNCDISKEQKIALAADSIE